MKTETNNGENEISVQCPKCNFIGDLDDFDVMGADDDKMFCNNCNAEVVVIVLDPNSNEEVETNAEPEEG